ncbi:hypothetical protein MHYP_G00034050 [Metynnis hypsauchen]
MPQIKEHFMGFLVAEESTGESLSSLIFKRLEELNIPFEDCRGQSYDNGANMKGKNKGVQARLLQQNSRAFFVPCEAHTLNLVVADAARSSPDAMKAWSETRWESRIKSVQAVRYQAGQVREALLEVRETAADPMVKVEAQCLSEEIGSYRFSICTVIWYDILNKIQHVSKLMQSPSMQLDVVVDLLKKARDFLTSYRHTGFSDAQITAKEMCEEMNVEVVLKQKRLRSTKRHFSCYIDGRELAMEMQNFPQLSSKNMTNMELLTFLHEKKLAEIYPNMWVALRISATLPVTVAAAERSFSRLKLIKTYLRSTMGQERLSGLSVISINCEISQQLSCDDVIDDFALKKAN